MKNIIAFIVLTFFTTVGFGQNQYVDVVFLKNGSVIRGRILERVPNKSVKIETEGNNIFVYKMEEIKKITKELQEFEYDIEDDLDIMSIDDKPKPGYVAVTIGPSFPTGDFADSQNGMANTGVNLTLINFGFLFSEHLGISASWFGAAYPLDNDDFDPWSYGGLMVGPLLSFELSENAEWDFKPMIGYAVTKAPDIGKGEEEATSFAINLGTLIRVHMSSTFSLALSADLFGTKAKFKDLGFEQDIGALSLGLGLAYRLD